MGTILFIIGVSLVGCLLVFIVLREAIHFFSPKGLPKHHSQVEAQSKALLEESRHYATQRDTQRQLVEEAEQSILAEQQEVSALEISCKTINESIIQEESTLAQILETNAALLKGIEKLGREVTFLKANAMLRQRAVIKGSPGDVFFVRVEIEAPQTESETKPTYPALTYGTEPCEGLGSLPLTADILPPLTSDPVPWAFADKHQGRVIVVEEEADTLKNRLFFVGDIHGDAETLRRIAEWVFRSNASAILVFLGDLFDRGKGNLEAVRLLIMLAHRFPGQILWLAGNHDIAFRYDETQEMFVSDVEPSEFKDWLNVHPEYKEEGRTLERIITDLPVALVLGNHWVTHGGVPQDDVYGDFTSFDTMSEQMLEDCVWSRMRDVKRKLVNRSHRGAEVGYENALGFFEHMKAVTGITIRHIVCAHQHEQKDGVGYLPFAKFFKPNGLTCQCIFSFIDTERSARPCCLTYRGDEIPTPHVF